MTEEKFTLTEEELNQIQSNHTNLGKNRDVGYLDVEIAKKYLKKKYLNIEFIPPYKVDLSARINGVIKNYEIKGTTVSTASICQLTNIQKSERTRSAQKFCRIIIH